MFRLSLSEIEILRAEAFVSSDTATLALCEVALGQTLTTHHEAALVEHHYGVARMADAAAKAEEARTQLRRLWICTPA